MSEFLVVFLGLTHLLTSSWQADHLESQMRELLKIQEGMDVCLDQRDEELRQLRSQSQSDGAQLAALSLQMQELISLVESRAECHGMTFSNLSFHLFALSFIILGLVSFLLLTFTLRT